MTSAVQIEILRLRVPFASDRNCSLRTTMGAEAYHE